MEGIKDIIASLREILSQLEAVAPEEEGEPEPEDEMEGESEAAPAKAEDDGFTKKKPMLVAMVKRAISK